MDIRATPLVGLMRALLSERNDGSDDGSDVKVIGIPWELYLVWMSDVWTPGKHFALVGPTGEGKTTFAVPVLQQRKWVLALDPKGEDETLAASGFQRITSLPLPRKIRNAVAEGKPARLIVGGSVDTDKEEAALRKLMRETIAMVRQQGGWTIYADEFQILSDARMFGLGKPIEQLLVSARSKGTSVMTAYQAPAWVPRAATRQAWGVAIWGTRDRAMIKSVAESMGRNWRDVETAVDLLPAYHVLVIPKSVRAPMVIVHPPAIN
jgi:hypothetical protein